MDVIIESQLPPEEVKTLAYFRDNHIIMNIDLGLGLQECEMDTFKNHSERWNKND